MGSRQANAALLRVKEVKEQVCLDVLARGVNSVALASDELDYVDLVAILERERLVTGFLDTISCRLDKVTEPFQCQ